MMPDEPRPAVAELSPEATVPESRLVPRICPLPTPLERRVDLATIDDIRREAAKVYRAMKSREIEPQDGTRLVYVLSQIGKLIEMGELEKRLEAVEGVLKGRRTT